MENHKHLKTMENNTKKAEFKLSFKDDVVIRLPKNPDDNLSITGIKIKDGCPFISTSMNPDSELMDVVARCKDYEDLAIRNNGVGDDINVEMHSFKHNEISFHFSETF